MTSSVTFNNAMRNKGILSNSPTQEPEIFTMILRVQEATLENHRIWMDLVSSNGETTELW